VTTARKLMVNVIVSMLLTFLSVVTCASALGRTDTAGHGRHVFGRIFIRNARRTDVAVRSSSSDIYSLPDWRLFQSLLFV